MRSRTGIGAQDNPVFDQERQAANLLVESEGSLPLPPSDCEVAVLAIKFAGLLISQALNLPAIKLFFQF